jgi:uncharacterized phage-encoded protein
MNEIKIFENSDFGEIRTLETADKKVLFCGTDVAKALGYSNPRKAISDHCRCVTKRDIPHPQSKTKTISMSFIFEGDVYRLIAHSHLPSAEKFESWIFDEVLPTIRRTGSYSIQSKPDSYMIDDPIQRAERWIEERKEKLALEQKIEQDKPLVEYASQIQTSEDTISMAEMAKIAAKNGIKIGRTRLFEFLRRKKILDYKNDEVVRYVIPIIKKVANDDETANFLKNSTNKKYGIYIERNGISEIYCMDTEDDQISYNVFDRINNHTMANELYGLYILMCDMLITKESQR